jgi:polyisoprenoid-binding protein YceI
MNMDDKDTRKVWLIDPVHSKIRFAAKYLLLTSVSGWFTEFEGTVLTSSDNFQDSQLQLTIYAHSLYTGNDERDNHLRSADFFDVKRFPTITFNSALVAVEDSIADVIGDLSIKGITETINFKAKYSGCIQDPMGNWKAGFEMNTLLNRKDFNITWNTFFDNSGVLLSDEVQVFCDVQLLKVSS